MKYLYLILLLNVLLVSCKKETSSNTEHRYIKWEVELPRDGEKSIYIQDPIIHKNKVIIPVRKQGILLALDKDTGKELWRWTEARDTYPGADGFGEKNYLFENILVTSQVNLTYGIDVNTGQTLWHDRNVDNGLSFVAGLNSTFVRSYRDNAEYVSIRTGDVYTGEMEEVYRFDREDAFNVSSNIPILFNHKGQTYATFNKIKWLSNAEGYFQDAWVHMLNMETKALEWVSDTIPKNYQLDNTAGLRPIYSEGNIIMTTRTVFAFSADDGSINWKDDTHTNIFDWSTHLTAADGKVFGNNENKYMIAWDVVTGTELWRTPTGGTGSRIEYHDGRCYITALTKAGTNSLMVLDANTGVVIHNIDAPYHEYGENNWYWDEMIAVDKETGLVYTADHNKVMCLELE